MARIRTVKPEFWEDEVTTAISRDARLLFIATFNYADDEGLLRWTPEKLKAAAFMYDDDITIRRTGDLMAELVDAGLVVTYKIKGSTLGWIVNFHKHQRINRPQPSKLPSPPLQNPAIARIYAERDDWACHLCSGPVNQVNHYVIDPYDPKGPPDISSLNPSLDHVRPRSEGGSDYPSNLRLAHLGCNKSRCNRPVDKFTPPSSVREALKHVLTSENEESVIVVPSFTDDSLNAHTPADDASVAEGEREGEGEETPSSEAAGATPTREDVDRICRHLAHNITQNGAKEPTINKGWLDAARLMLDKDGRPEPQVHQVIDWATNDDFWRANILSVPKLREKYDQLLLKAKSERSNVRPLQRAANDGPPPLPYSPDDRR